MGKTGQAITDVIIQEGVLTAERINDAVAEPVVYLMDRYVVGGFYRVHAERGPDENLNAPGSTFVPLARSPRVRASPARPEAGRQRAQPLLHVRRDRPAGHAGGQLRAGSDRSGSRELRLIARRRVAALQQARCRGGAAHNSGPLGQDPNRRRVPGRGPSCRTRNQSSRR